LRLAAAMKECAASFAVGTTFTDPAEPFRESFDPFLNFGLMRGESEPECPEALLNDLRIDAKKEGRRPLISGAGGVTFIERTAGLTGRVGDADIGRGTSRGDIAV